MATFILTFTIVALVIAGMALGSIFQNKPLKGTCGGLAALDLGSDCEICGGDRVKCDEFTQQNGEGNATQSLGYDATKTDNLK